MEHLSDLERATLGILHNRGPLTAYSVRREFETSNSSHWSGSSGAIYPLLKRLEKRGHLASDPISTGKRRGRLYRLTEAGMQALLEWLQSPVEEDEAQLTYDRIRLRVAFLPALSPAERKRMLDGAERRLDEVLGNMRRDLEESDEDPLEQLGALGGVRVLEARLAWVREIRGRLIELDGEQGERG
jgi:DNA-binding PadR family transcriptional regulator